MSDLNDSCNDIDGFTRQCLEREVRSYSNDLGGPEEGLKVLIKEFDNPLEAIGIVMRETDFSFSPSGKVCEFPERYHAWFMGNLGEATIPADSEGSLTGENILNTLKEGK